MSSAEPYNAPIAWVTQTAESSSTPRGAAGVTAISAAQVPGAGLRQQEPAVALFSCHQMHKPAVFLGTVTFNSTAKVVQQSRGAALGCVAALCSAGSSSHSPWEASRKDQKRQNGVCGNQETSVQALGRSWSAVVFQD